MSRAARRRPQAVPEERPLFPARDQESSEPPAEPEDADLGRKSVASRSQPEDIRAIQDLIWKEALFAVQAAQPFTDETEFQAYLSAHLPQNSPETRTRYAQTLLRWFFQDGIRGLAAEVWRHYHIRALAEEVLRYLYLRAEPMAGAAVADALFPIAEGSFLPASYLSNFVRSRFGVETPDKSVKRLKSNLRKLGFLARGRDERDTLRPLSPTGTAFLILLHYLFAQKQAGGVEFRALAADPFWKYLGFKSEDRLRDALKLALNRNLLAKYVVADRIESVSFRYTFAEFVTGGKAL